jgi:putative heme-binding domain-containing protein
MNHIFKSTIAAACALFCAFSPAKEARGQTTLPEGKGKAEFVDNCTACHSARLVTRVKKTPDEWKDNVIKMAGRGTSGTKEDLDNATQYLITFFSTETPTATTATPPPDVKRARRVIADNSCLACHRIENKGMYTGPTLNGLGAHHTTDEIRSAIVSPHPNLTPANSQARLTTAAGTTIVGRVLSQDDHDLRIIDASGEITTYSKPQLRQITPVTSNPMPPSGSRITGEDLDNLVRYLGSLPSLDETPKK